MKTLAVMATMMIVAAFCQPAEAQLVEYLTVVERPGDKPLVIREIVEQPRQGRRVRQAAQPVASQRVAVEQPRQGRAVQKLVQQVPESMRVASGQQVYGGAVNGEHYDLARSISSFNQSWTVPGYRTPFGAWVPSQGFHDGMGVGPSYRLIDHPNHDHPPYWHPVGGMRRGHIPPIPQGERR